MGAFENIGLAESAAVLAEAKAIGKTLTLTHRATSAATLYFLPIEQSIGKELRRGRLVETGTLDAVIPVQSGFAVMTTNARPITEGDLCEYPVSSGRYFFVKSEEDVKQEAHGYVYRVKFTEKKSLTFGATS